MAKDTIKTADPDKTLTLTASQLDEIVARMVENRLTEKQAEQERELSETDKAVQAWLNELVPVRLFRDGRDYKDDVFVGVNGYRAQIKRGMEVMVPRRVAHMVEVSLSSSNEASDRLREVANFFAGM